MTFGEVCEHGSLRRQCLTCEQAEQLKSFGADGLITIDIRILNAADALAKAARDAKRLCPVAFKDDIVLGNIWFALSAYEKARG